MDELAMALIDHLDNKFTQLKIEGGPIYPQYEPTGHDFHWELSLPCGPGGLSDVLAPVARLKLLGTQLHLYTGVDASRYQFQDRKCGQLDYVPAARNPKTDNDYSKFHYKISLRKQLQPHQIDDSYIPYP